MKHQSKPNHSIQQIRAAVQATHNSHVIGGWLSPLMLGVGNSDYLGKAHDFESIGRGCFLDVDPPNHALRIILNSAFAIICYKNEDDRDQTVVSKVVLKRPRMVPRVI